MQVFAVLPSGLEEEGCKEMVQLGALNVKKLRRCVFFEADMACLYRLYLNARLPFRFLREITSFSCSNAKDLYFGVQNSFDWNSWLNPSLSFRVDVSGSSLGLPHSHFSALQVKNAVIDLQRNFYGQRSDISLDHPDICIHLHLSDQGAVLSLDGSGQSLHRRGYRAAMGEAPIKENLASGLISLTSWNGTTPLIDPLCGSGTLLIEAAAHLKGICPGLNKSFILKNWLDFDIGLWNKEKSYAKEKLNPNKNFPFILGCENNKQVAQEAKDNVISACLENLVVIQNTHFREIHLPKQKGILVCNPPYGKRIGVYEDLEELYFELGDFLKSNASGWDLWILSGNKELTRFLRMKANRKFPINNGGIECRWINYSIN